jgi:hypothetical protein
MDVRMWEGVKGNYRDKQGGRTKSRGDMGLGGTASFWLDFGFHHLDQCHSMIEEDGKQSRSVSMQLRSDFQAIPLWKIYSIACLAIIIYSSSILASSSVKFIRA